MKKINAKKLNQFFMSSNNSNQLKSIVETAVSIFINEPDQLIKTPMNIEILNDLGLLIESK